MGNVISSVKSSLQRIGDVYLEYTKKLYNYRYECLSCPLIENIINNVILIPCKCIVALPVITVKWPKETIKVLGTSILVIVVPTISYDLIKKYGITNSIMMLAGCSAGAYACYLLVLYQIFMGKYLDREAYREALNNYARNDIVRYSGDPPGTYRYGMSLPNPEMFLRVPLTWDNMHRPFTNLLPSG